MVGHHRRGKRPHHIGRADRPRLRRRGGLMATSNRDRIGQMLEVLAPALNTFIGNAVGPGLPPSTPWTVLVAAKDAKKGVEGKEYDSNDPQVQLRMLTENIPHQVKPGWYPF